MLVDQISKSANTNLNLNHLNTGYILQELKKRKNVERLKRIHSTVLYDHE